LRKQKEATDWEKQWDDDDDDDDSDGIDGADTNVAPQHLCAQVSPLNLPSQLSHLQQSLESREGGQLALNTHQPSDLLDEISPLPDLSGTIPVSPPMNLLQLPCVTPNAAEEQSHTSVALHQVAKDLLSKPLEDSLPFSDHHTLSENTKLDWEIDFKEAADESLIKPSVQMFMPMLRVLGKGSFGKVCIIVLQQNPLYIGYSNIFIGRIGAETRRKE
jgi:hypothetical protein